MADSKRTRIRVVGAVSPDPVHMPAPVEKTGKGGRPPGAANKLAMQARQAAQATGELPHEFLLRICRGQVITTPVLNQETGEVTQVTQIPDLPMRMEATKAAAPYFAPKLSAVEWTANLNDGVLDELISQYAGQAGLGVAAAGEGKAGADQDGPPAADSWI